MTSHLTIRGIITTNGLSFKRDVTKILKAVKAQSL